MSYLGKRLFFVFLLIFFVFPQNIYAASITLSEFSPNSIADSNEEIGVKVQLNINSDDGTLYYLRGVFSKDDSTNYCGATWNGSEWFSGPYSTSENWKKFPSVTISSSSAIATLRVKLDVSDSGCRESGNYKFKIQRFTVSGSGNYDDQNIQTLTVTLPTFTPTPHPTDIPSATSVPPITSSPTNTPKPTLKLSSTPLPTIYSDREGLESESNIGAEEINDSLKVLGESIKNDEASKSAELGSSSFIVCALIGAGGVFIAISCYAFIRVRRMENKT